MNDEPRIFVDTNILVYAYDHSAGHKHNLAVHLMEECWKNENGCLSIQVLQEFFVNVTQKIAIPLELQTARQIIEDLTHWHIHTPESSDLLRAIDFLQEYRLSFWDAMILQSAARLSCTKLISEDLNHGQSFGKVLVINPFLGNN